MELGKRLDRPVVLVGLMGVGKSTVGRRLAKRLGLSFVDTGALYRTVALSARRQGIAPDDDAALGALLPRIDIAFRSVGEENRVYLDGEDVSTAIRTMPVEGGISPCRGTEACGIKAERPRPSIPACPPCGPRGRGVSPAGIFP